MAAGTAGAVPDHPIAWDRDGGVLIGIRLPAMWDRNRCSGPTDISVGSEDWLVGEGHRHAEENNNGEDTE